MIRYLIIAIILSSCSVVKHIQKNDQSNSSKTETKTEEKTKKETQSDLISKTTTTELLDSSVSVAGSNASGSKPLADLQHGKSLILEDGNQSIKVSLDSSGNVKAEALIKPRIIPVKIKKTIQHEEQLKQTIKSSSDSTGNEKIKSKSKIITQSKDVTKSFGIPWWVWLLILVLIIVGLILHKSGILKISFL
jgi:hypothetical protein